MAVKFSSWGNHQFVIPTTGAPASGYKLKTYVAGSSTPVATYTTSAGDVSQGTTITLNSAGFPTTGQIWILEGTSIKIEFTDPSDVVLKTEDNISGVNDAVLSTSEWMNGPAPSFISTTSFSLVGDQTSTFHVGRRVKTTNSGGTIYSRISATAYTTLTTVTVVNDSGVLDSGLSAVEYGILSATNFAIPKLTETNKRLIDLPGLADANTWTNTQILSGTLTMSGKSVIDANASIAAHATTMDPWSLGNYVTATGTAVTFTALANAPQAGAEVEIYMNAAHIWTDNANLEVDGDANWTAEVGDRVFLRAKSTTVTTVRPVRKGGNVVVQSVISTSSVVSADVTAMPDDNTIPQNTEGYQYLSVSITPKSTTNRLFIEVLIHGFASANNSWSAALFQDDVVDALTAAKVVTTPNTNVLPLYFAWEMAAGTVSSTTFKVRAGQAAGATFTFNGQAGADWFGGVLNSYIRVTEIGR